MVFDRGKTTGEGSQPGQFLGTARLHPAYQHLSSTSASLWRTITVPNLLRQTLDVFARAPSAFSAVTPAFSTSSTGEKDGLLRLRENHILQCLTSDVFKTISLHRVGRRIEHRSEALHRTEQRHKLIGTLIS